MQTNILRILSTILLLCVIVVVVLGAYTRLADAGLGCPDWPTCYGHLWVPDTDEEITAANRQFADTPVEQDKTWPEQIHRIFASSLGVFILCCFYIVNARYARQNNKTKLNSVSGLLIALVTATAMRIKLGEMIEPIIVLLLIGYFGNLIRLTVTNTDATNKRFLLLALLSGLVILQGLFGMWTVTLLLWPKVVTAHLLGGFTILSLLALFWKGVFFEGRGLFTVSRPIRRFSFAVLAAVIVQIALGGWVSSNYAALACPDFPLCQNQVIPEANFESGFNLLQKIGPNYLGGQLDNKARVAIHFSHRVGAIVVTLAILTLAFLLFATRDIAARYYAAALTLVLALQITLGISNIVFALPLTVAVLHNAGGAMLLVTVIFAISSQKTYDSQPSRSSTEYKAT
jgi:cytochrome c oxidase assembly protein subunit 15